MGSSGKCAKAQKHCFHLHGIDTPSSLSLKLPVQASLANGGSYISGHSPHDSIPHGDITQCLPLLFWSSISYRDHVHGMHQTLSWVLSYFFLKLVSFREALSLVLRCSKDLLSKWEKKKLTYSSCKLAPAPSTMWGTQIISEPHSVYVALTW